MCACAVEETADIILGVMSKYLACMFTQESCHAAACMGSDFLAECSHFGKLQLKLHSQLNNMDNQNAGDQTRMWGFRPSLELVGAGTSTSGIAGTTGHVGVG